MVARILVLGLAIEVALSSAQESFPNVDACPLGTSLSVRFDAIVNKSLETAQTRRVSGVIVNSVLPLQIAQNLQLRVYRLPNYTSPSTNRTYVDVDFADVVVELIALSPLPPFSFPSRGLFNASNVSSCLSGQFPWYNYIGYYNLGCTDAASTNAPSPPPFLPLHVHFLNLTLISN
jgi:hypothetical protein